MQNFVFHNPTKILFGRGKIASIGEETRAWGKRALLAYGQQSIKTNGLHDQVTNALHQAGVQVVDFGGIRSNPLLSHVRQGIQLAKAQQIEVIVAVGGGSVIDSAKAIAAGAVAEHEVWKFFTGKKGVKQSLPVVCVATLAASGSEMNSGMVITNDQTREKFGFGHRLLYPKTSILDPEVTFSVPPALTAYGAVDALSHVLEFYLTAQDTETPVQARLMEGLIENAMTSCERCLNDPCDYNARADLMWTAALALSGLTAAGLGRVAMPIHLIAHALGALYNLPHGLALAALIPGWLRYHASLHQSRLCQLGLRSFSGRHAADTLSSAESTIDWLCEWLQRIHAPTSLSEIGLNARAIPLIAANSQGQARLWRLRDLPPEKIAVILELCLEPCTGSSHP